MSKMSPLKRFLAALFVSVSGMLAITGCSSATQKTDFYNQEAKDIETFANNLDNPKAMKEIIKATKKQSEKLNKAYRKAKEKEKSAEWEAAQAITVENELNAFIEIQNLMSVRELATQPASNSGLRNIANGLKAAGISAKEIVNGEDLKIAAESAKDYMEVDPDSKPLVVAYEKLAEASYTAVTGQQPKTTHERFQEAIKKEIQKGKLNSDDLEGQKRTMTQKANNNAVRE